MWNGVFRDWKSCILCSHTDMHWRTILELYHGTMYMPFWSTSNTYECYGADYTYMWYMSCRTIYRSCIWYMWYNMWNGVSRDGRRRLCKPSILCSHTDMSYRTIYRSCILYMRYNMWNGVFRDWKSCILCSHTDMQCRTTMELYHGTMCMPSWSSAINYDCYGA